MSLLGLVILLIVVGVLLYLVNAVILNASNPGCLAAIERCADQTRCAPQ